MNNILCEGQIREGKSGGGGGRSIETQNDLYTNYFVSL